MTRSAWLWLVSVLLVSSAVVTLVLQLVRVRDDRPDLPDIFLVTVDTLRADHVGCYGAPTPTPCLDRLASEGQLFEVALTPMPETRPAHLSLFSSLYPHQHGVASNATPWRAQVVTLPHILRDSGFMTAGFVGCGLFTAKAGARLGFSHFDTPARPQRPAPEVVGAALDWLAGIRAATPVFLWLHLFDPHMPYEPPPPYNRGSSDEMVRSWPSLSWSDLVTAAAKTDGDLPGALLRRGRALYAGEVTYVDSWLDRFFSRLAELGRWDDALVVLTADHGECFSKGVYFDHSHCLNEGALAVPLIVRYLPRLQPGLRHSASVELLDIAPTMLRLVGLTVPQSFQGQGLLARQGAPAAPAFFSQPRYLPIETSTRNRLYQQLRSVNGEPTMRVVPGERRQGCRYERWKYLQTGAQAHLFDVVEDPDESIDLAAEQPAEVEHLRQAVARWSEQDP